MANSLHSDYDYMDESGINDFLKCDLCRRPFIDPVSASNGKNYCRTCFIDGSTTDKRIEVSESSAPVTEKIVIEMLNAILVRCLRCEMKDIRRGDFHKHILTVCPRAQVQCTAADIRCPWIGPREELNDHFRQCRFEPLRPVLGQIFFEQNQMKTRIERLETQLLGQQFDQLATNEYD